MNKNIWYNDKYWIALARKGDANAYNQLLSKYSGRINQLIYANVNDTMLVHDLAQEVFVKVYRYLSYFKEDSKFSTWLYRITQNTIKNYYRSNAQRLESEAQFASEQNQSPSVSPEYLLILMEFNEQIKSTLFSLSDELKNCYEMHVFEGRSYEDIAKKMHCPIGTVRSRMFRARKLLMGSLKKSRLNEI